MASRERLISDMVSSQGELRIALSKVSDVIPDDGEIMDLVAMDLADVPRLSEMVERMTKAAYQAVSWGFGDAAKTDAAATAVDDVTVAADALFAAATAATAAVLQTAATANLDARWEVIRTDRRLADVEGDTRVSKPDAVAQQKKLARASARASASARRTFQNAYVLQYGRT